MDTGTTAAAHALAAGDPLLALKGVALRDDAHALALRGIAMAQLGDLARASVLLRSAARSFGVDDRVSKARCTIAEAEIALVRRDLGRSFRALGPARAVLEAHGDMANAAHAGYLEARKFLLIGQLDQAETALEAIHVERLHLPSQAGYWLVVAGIAMRRIRTRPARHALDLAQSAADEAGIGALRAEVGRARRALEAPAATMTAQGHSRLLGLAEVEDLLRSDTLVIDACRNLVRFGTTTTPLGGRRILFALARELAEAWPNGVARTSLLERVFGAKQADESHRARLRVEIGRLRKALQPFADLVATSEGFALKTRVPRAVAVLAPPDEGEHAEILALLADGEAWSSSALASALGVSPRTVQRALETLSHTNKAQSFGRGRACRWIGTSMPGFPSSLLLPTTLMSR